MIGGKETASKIRERIARQKNAIARKRRIAKAQADLAAQHAAKPVERYHERIARLGAAAKRARLADDGRWCIVTTSSAQTLALAESLIHSGIEAWTPAEEAERRKGRQRARQYVDAPLLPGVVFVREEHLRDLTSALALPINPHPAFSIFVHAGRVPFVKDKKLEPLRKHEADAIEEARDRARAKRKAIPLGAKVKIDKDPNFLGLVGIVEACDGKSAMISFGGRQTFKIDTWRLLVDELQDAGKSS